MVYVAVLCLGLLQSPDALVSRIETLRFHVERLDAITVPETLLPEKKSRLAELNRMLDADISDEDTFNSCYEAIDTVRQWLWASALERPKKLEETFTETDSVWRIHNELLTLSVDKNTLALEVQTPGHHWQFAGADEKDLEFEAIHAGLNSAKSIEAEAFNTGCSVGMSVRFKDFADLPGFELRTTYRLFGPELVVDIAAKESDQVLLLLNWPKAVVLDNSPDTVSVIPRMQGMLLPGDWPQHIEAADLCNSRSFYMGWWGHIQQGAGIQTILETPDDAGGFYRHLKGGPTTAGPRWYSSMGKLGYQRTLRYVFDDNSSYVNMAKRYRRFMIETGRFVTLREKATRTPALDRVIGKPVIHLGALYHFVKEASLYNKERVEANHNLQTFDQLREQLEALKAKGVDAAYVHLDGWGYYGYDNGHPDVMPVGEIQGGWEGLRNLADACADMNYLFAVHDQYRDFYLNAVSYDERLVLKHRDGGHDVHSVWCGGPQTFLNTRFAPEYVRRNHDLFAANTIKVQGAYLDVFSVVPLEESYHPTHPMTRTECARYRRECFDLLRARGYVVSSEEPVDYLAPTLDLVHHGPYATYPNLGGGEATGIPVPLFNLVYHDSILLPWDMGEDGSWGIPKGDAGRLHCLLNAGLPYLWPGADDAQIARTLEAADWARHCAFEELVSHEFLDEGRRRQRATYSNGATVTVDFATGESLLQKAEHK